MRFDHPRFAMLAIVLAGIACQVALPPSACAQGSSDTIANYTDQAMDAKSRSLLDVVMDGVDGFEACRKISNDTSTNSIPIYFVTSKNQKADRVWGELQGGRGMISKPYTPDQILQTISSV